MFNPKPAEEKRIQETKIMCIYVSAKETYLSAKEPYV